MSRIINSNRFWASIIPVLGVKRHLMSVRSHWLISFANATMLLVLLLALISSTLGLIYRDTIVVPPPNYEQTLDDNINSLSPLVPCDFLPSDYYYCESVDEIGENETRSCQKFNGRRFGGQRYSQVQHTSVMCWVFDGIECRGNRSFLLEHIPCVKYSSHYFVSTLLYSIFLGLFAVDRFCLGHIGIGVGKMITLGGLGLWWLIDVALLITGRLMPADESNWVVEH